MGGTEEAEVIAEGEEGVVVVGDVDEVGMDSEADFAEALAEALVGVEAGAGAPFPIDPKSVTEFKSVHRPGHFFSNFIPFRSVKKTYACIALPSSLSLLARQSR